MTSLILTNMLRMENFRGSGEGVALLQCIDINFTSNKQRVLLSMMCTLKLLRLTTTKAVYWLHKRFLNNITVPIISPVDLKITIHWKYWKPSFSFAKRLVNYLRRFWLIDPFVACYSCCVFQVWNYYFPNGNVMSGSSR